jgi:hypothetical protein
MMLPAMQQQFIHSFIIVANGTYFVDTPHKYTNFGWRTRV